MKNENEQVFEAAAAQASKAQYVAPVVRVMSEAEVLSAFQVTAAGSTVWWTM